MVLNMENEITKRLNIIKQFDKLFYKKEQYTEEDIAKDTIPKTNYKGYMDKTSVVMVIPKKHSFNNKLIADFEVEEHKVPDLDYTLTKPVGYTSKYSCEYLGLILQLCKHYDAIKISLKEDYPMKLETTDFIVIIAPRVDS